MQEGGDLADTVARGLVEIPPLPAPVGFEVVWRSAEPQEFEELMTKATHVFVDGSASQTRHPAGRRAAWAFVAVRRDEALESQQILCSAR